MKKIEIEKVENGWILTYYDEYEDTGLPYSRKKVFSFNENIIIGDERLEELTALQLLLWEINEMVGVPYAKNKKNNINIEIIS